MPPNDASYMYYAIDLHGIRYPSTAPAWRIDQVLCWDVQAVFRDPRMREESGGGSIGVLTMSEFRELHERFTQELSPRYEEGSLAHESQMEIDERLAANDTMFVVVHLYLNM